MIRKWAGMKMTLIKRKLTVSIIILIILGVLFLPVVVFASKISDASSIGGVPVENLTIEEAEVELRNLISEWLTGDPLEATNDFETLEIPREIFQFDLETSVKQLEEKMKRHWSNFFMKKENIHQELFVSLVPNAEEILNWPEYVEIETTLNHALMQAGNLKDNSVSLVYVEGASLELEEAASVSLEIPAISEATVTYLIDNLNEQMIKPNVLYSFLDENILPDGMSNAEKETSFLASAMYQLVLQSNIDIIERHPQKEIQSYTEAGLEAKVDRDKALDLRLYHTNNAAYTMKASMDDETINLTLETAENNLNYDISIENEVEIEPRKIYRYNRDLAAGTEELIQEGELGLQVEIYRSSNDAEAGKELVARDYYAPTPEIIETSVLEETEAAEEQAPINEEMQITPPDVDSIVDQWIPQVDERQAICEEDPSNPDCQYTDASLMPLLLSCLMNSSSLQTPVEIEDGEAAVENQSSSFCELFMFYLLLNMADDGLIDQEAGNIDEIDVEDEEWEVESDTDVNEEEREEVRY